MFALRSNIRWCSNHLELTSRRGDFVRILSRQTLRFCADVIDACNREIIAWSAIAHAGISGELVRDQMIKVVERRFASTKTSHPVKWLLESGSAYIAK